MMETFTDDGALASWSTPQCPFVIEYSRKALDDIRLAVVDAFFSLPRGGAEIGGVLLGKFQGQRLQILDYAPIECEHAFGPVFTLSPSDQVRLGEMLGQHFPGGLKPVGWYHSHTRSEIALCDADVDIHNRYFPEAWQVALILRPSTLHPTQAGFFFREADGTIRAQSSYQEFVVEALPVQQIPMGIPQAVPGPMREANSGGIVISATAQISEPAPATVPEPPAPAALLPTSSDSSAASEAEQHSEQDFERPNATVQEIGGSGFTAFESHHEPRDFEESEYPETHKPTDTEKEEGFARLARSKQHPRWLGMAAGLAIGLLLGVTADRASSHDRVSSAAARPAIQKQTPEPIRTAPQDAALRKRNEELERQVAELSQQNNSLRKETSDLVQEQTQLANQKTESGKLQQQRDDLVKQTAKLKADLGAQTARALSLQQQLDDLRRQQQRRRLSIQSTEPLP